MSTNEPSVFDHVEHYPQEDDAMSPNASDDEYFKPSLHSLVGRKDVQHEHDAESVTSVRTVSDAETVSDHTEGFDIVGEQSEGHDNMADSFDDLSFDEVNEARKSTGAAKRQPRHVTEDEEDELRLSTNSDRTLKPTKDQSGMNSVATSRVLSEENDNDNNVDDYAAASDGYPIAEPLHKECAIDGLDQAPQLYQAPRSPLRVMLIADARTEQAVKTSIVLTLMSAVIQSEKPLTKCRNIAIREPQMTGDGSSLSAVEYYASYLGAKAPEAIRHISIVLDHAVGTDLSKECLAMKGGDVIRIAESPLPDLVVFYHNQDLSDACDSDAKPTFPCTLSGSAIARAISARDVPMLEMCANNNQIAKLSCVTDSLHLDRTRCSKDVVPISTLCPVPLSYFPGVVAYEDLSRHLAFISKTRQNKILARNKKWRQDETIPPISRSKTGAGMMAAKWWMVALSLSVLATGLFTSQWMQWMQGMPVDASTALTARRDLLQTSLDKWGLHDVNASSILRYPTTTTVLSGTTTSQVAYPTAMDVVVAKPDQLFISLPKDYGRSFSLGVLKNGKKLQVNATSLMDVVTVLYLDPEEAHGRVLVNVVTRGKPQINETVQVDLGNRLLQRATYEKAANRMQQTVQRDVSEVHSAAMAFQNALKQGACSAANTSASRALAMRNGLFKNALGAVHRLSDGYKFTANTTTRFAQNAGHAVMFAHSEAMHDIKEISVYVKNATSSVGTFLKNSVPSKGDMIRARTNSLKLRAKLQGKAAAPKQKPVRKHNYLPAIADITELPSRFERQCRNLLQAVGALSATTNPVHSAATSKAAKKWSAKAGKLQGEKKVKLGDERQCNDKKGGLK